MTREERLAILGPEAVAHIHALVDAAPEPTREVVEKLRRILTCPGGDVPSPQLADTAADAA
jgi:DNA-directed RNA polymerase subunit F